MCYGASQIQEKSSSPSLIHRYSQKVSVGTWCPQHGQFISASRPQPTRTSLEPDACSNWTGLEEIMICKFGTTDGYGMISTCVHTELDPVATKFHCHPA